MIYYGIKKIFIFLLICLSFSGFAQRYGKIFLNEKKVSVLNSKERSYLKKSVYEVVYFTGVFDLVIGKYKKNLSKEESFSIDVIINSTKRDRQFANVELRLREIKSNKLINVVTSKGVPRIKLQYTLRKLLFKLFYEENYDEENDVVLENKVIPIASISKGMDSPAITPKASEEGKVNETLSTVPDAVPEVIVASTVSDKEIKEASLKKKKKKKKDEVKISKFDSPDIEIIEEEKKNVFIPTSFEIHNQFYINIGQSSDVVESETIIETTTETKQIKFELGSRFRIGTSDDFFEPGMSVGQLIGDNEYKLTAGIKFYFDYAKSLYSRNIYISPNLEYEKFSFADLSTAGQGVVPWNNTLLWFGAKGRIHFFEDRLEAYAGFSKSFIGTSDLGKKGESFPIDGTKIGFGTNIQVYKKIGVGAVVESVALSSTASSSFKADYESFKVYLTYR
jgi:hypothetical protein